MRLVVLYNMESSGPRKNDFIITIVTTTHLCIYNRHGIMYICAGRRTHCLYIGWYKKYKRDNITS